MLASNILRNLGKTTTRITRRIHDDRPIDRGDHPHPLKFVPVDITNTKKFAIIFTLYVSSALMLPVGILFYQLRK